jgi:hypothetical protein
VTGEDAGGADKPLEVPIAMGTADATYRRLFSSRLSAAGVAELAEAGIVEWLA